MGVQIPAGAEICLWFHLCPLANSVTRTLIIHCQLEYKVARVRVGHVTLCADAKDKDAKTNSRYHLTPMAASQSALPITFKVFYVNKVKRFVEYYL